MPEIIPPFHPKNDTVSLLRKTSLAAGDGNGLPPSPETDCRSERQTVADNEKSKDVSLSPSERSFKRSTGFNALKKAGPVKKINEENLFLKIVAELMDLWKPNHSEFEMTNSGAWWRQCYRANADLIQRVVADLKCAIVEGRIKTTPGQYAVDLWKRWSKDVLKAAGRAAART